MANITSIGSAVVLKSALTLATLKKVAKYNPAALEQRDEKEKLVFKLAIAGEGEGSICDKAIYFAPVSHDADGKATVTMMLPASAGTGDAAKDYIVDLMGKAYQALVAMEGAVIEAETAVDTYHAEMRENIEVQ